MSKEKLTEKLIKERFEKIYYNLRKERGEYSNTIEDEPVFQSRDGLVNIIDYLRNLEVKK